MTKLEDALVELVVSRDRVKELSKQIGEAICASQEAQVPAGTYSGREPTDWLKLAYEMASEPDGSGYGYERYYVNHEDDVEGYLASNCQHALLAHRLIQQRRAAKRVAGEASRRVSMMGRQLVKSRTP